MKILGYTYTVVQDGDVDSMGAMGRSHCRNLKIQVASDVAEEQKVSTLLHEIVEALNWHLQLEIEHPKIMALEAGLYQVLKDNGVDLSPLFAGETRV